MKGLARRAIGAAAIVLPVMACGGLANSFEVHAPGAKSAELHLCGEVSSLERRGDVFTANRAIRCEGAGAVMVYYHTGKSVRCVVGYVTPGMKQKFRFIIENGRCP